MAGRQDDGGRPLGLPRSSPSWRRPLLARRRCQRPAGQLCSARGVPHQRRLSWRPLVRGARVAGGAGGGRDREHATAPLSGATPTAAAGHASLCGAFGQRCGTDWSWSAAARHGRRNRLRRCRRPRTRLSATGVARRPRRCGLARARGAGGRGGEGEGGSRTPEGPAAAGPRPASRHGGCTRGRARRWWYQACIAQRPRRAALVGGLASAPGRDGASDERLFWPRCLERCGRSCENAEGAGSWHATRCRRP